ncbi:MAG TPA: hypothetical protein VHB73_08070, partial [Alphaproteobacteria bacterium]|nr:hypothetical protein [Alphaproteobacteria bacterium]
DIAENLNREQLAQFSGGAAAATAPAGAEASANVGGGYETPEETSQRQQKAEAARLKNRAGPPLGGANGYIVTGATPVSEPTPDMEALREEQAKASRYRAGPPLGGADGYMHIAPQIPPVAPPSEEVQALRDRQAQKNIETRANYGPRPS